MAEMKAKESKRIELFIFKKLADSLEQRATELGLQPEINAKSISSNQWRQKKE